MTSWDYDFESDESCVVNEEQMLGEESCVEFLNENNKNEDEKKLTIISIKDYEPPALKIVAPACSCQDNEEEGKTKNENLELIKAQQSLQAQLLGYREWISTCLFPSYNSK